MKKLSFFLMAMLFSVMSFAAESLLVTLDFSKNTWGLPVASANKTTATVNYTSGDYTITLAGGGSGNGHYYNNDGYLMLGKSGATLTLPAFDFKTTKIVVTGRTGASASVLQNIYVGSTAVSTQTKGAAVTNTYAIAEDYQAAGNVYVLKVSSSHNTQIVKMEIYGEEGGEQGEKVDAPKFSVTETNFNKAFDLTISSAEGTTLKYTTDNTDPKTSETAVAVETNTANVAIPAKSTVVNAVAVKGDLVSVVASKIYAYVNSPETAYTVAEAMEVIDAGLGLENELYVKGEISEIETFNATYGSITYWIKDEEGNKFECYSGLGLNKAKFTSVDDLVVGSKVVVCGVMKKYDTTYEFNYNNYIVSLELPVAKFTVTATAENGTVTGAGEYIENAEVTLEATPAEGYEFVNWTKGEEVVSTENPYTFVVTADVALVANFKEVVVEEPVEAKLYLTPNANWLKDNARFAAYFFGNGETWVSMTKVAGETNLYEVAVPTTKVYPNVIFCRMNPSAAANNWTNKWNQTDDLVIPTDGKNHYTVKENTWDKGGGTWSVWPLPLERTYVDVTIIVTANAPASIKWANAGDKLADATDYVAMTAGENNTYTYTLAQVDEATGVDYTIKVGDFVSVEQNTSKNVTIDFKALLPQVAVQGVNNWDGTDKMTIADDYLTASITLPLVAKKYDLKLTVDGAWKGTTSNNITRENNSSAFTGDSGNGSITADVEGDYVFTYTYATKTLTVTYPKLPAKPEVVTEMVGIVKRAIQNGDNTIVLTHEADGTAHIYELANGTILELVQEGVVPVDPENAGDFLAISDIAVTEDGKLVATNKIVCQASDNEVDAGYKRGELRAYIWDDLAGAPSVLLTSKMSSNWYRSVQGNTIAYKGTSTDGTLFTTGVTATGVKFRYSVYNVINGVYTEPAVNDSEHFHFTKGSAQTTDGLGANYQLVASPLAATNWILDGELVDPFEIVDPLTYNTEVTANPALAIDLGKKYNGTSIVTVGEKHLMVAPYADAEGKLAGVKVLDITAGLDAATEVATADLDAAVEATAAATAVAVAENTLTITLVADATIYTLNVELESEPEYWVIEDNITNLVIDTESMAIMGGPSTMWQVEVYLGLAEDDNMDGQWSLSPESSVAIMGFDARFIDGYVYDIDVNAPAAKAVLHVEDNGSFYEIKLDMTNTPQEAIVVVVEDATVQIDTIPLFGDQVDYALKMTANWTYAEDGVTYPVLVEVPVYYPEATEPSEMTCTVTIGEDDYDPWLGFGEGTLTITTVDGVVTAKGIVVNPYTQVAFDVTVSGKLPAAEPVKHTVTITVNPEGAGTVTGAGEYADGAEVTVTAEANEGYIFLGWMEDGEFVAEDYEYTFTILNDVDLVAVYATQLVGVAEDLVITETALTATAILSTGTTLTVNLVLGEYDEEQGAYWLAETTTLTLGDKELTFLEGLVMVDTEQQTAIAAVLAEHEGVFYAFTLVLAAPASGVDNINTNVAPRKVIRDGQLIIIKNGVEYNVQGATLK